MRGQDPLIAMRRNRQRPTMFVSIDVDGGTWLADHWHAEGLQPFILIESSDAPARVDLRFLVGLDVHVSGPESARERVSRIAKACAASGARRVLQSLTRTVCGESRTIEHTDTKGIIEWHE